MIPKNDQWQTEFVEFLGTPSVDVPKDITRTFSEKIKEQLNPSLGSVLSKIAFIHTLIGVLTLPLCAQFGISPFGWKGLWVLFQRTGPYGCMVLCGALFLGVGTIVAVRVLRPEEIRVFWPMKEFGYVLMSLVYVVAFHFLGVASMPIPMELAWFFGALASGVFFFRWGRHLRFPKWPTLGLST